MIRSLIFLLFASLIVSCTHKVKTDFTQTKETLDYKDEIVVIPLDEKAPEDCEYLGTVKLKDTGFSTKCTFSDAINLAQLESRKAGGNIIKITKHKYPNFLFSTCHRINADVYYSDSPEIFTEDKTDFIKDVDYAILKIYRNSSTAPLINYNLKQGDKTICRVRNNFKATLHTYDIGEHVFSARTEAKDEVTIALKAGHTYYIRCDVGMGAFVGRPKLELVNPSIGKLEFESFKAKHNE